MSAQSCASTLLAPVAMPQGDAARAVAGARLTGLARGLPDGLTVRMMDLDDSRRLTDFRVRVVATLEDPDHYRMAGEVGNFVADHLGDKGVTAGIFRDGRLVAYGALGLPGPKDPNRGRDLDLPEEELSLVAHMSSAMVDPSERGRGLHHRLIDWRLEVAEALGCRHLVTTVSTRNHRSWGHLAGHGVYPKRMLRVGGDLVRLLVHRDFQANPVFDTATAGLVAIDALAGRWDVFERGHVWGRVALGEGADLRWYALHGRAR
ncbi:GNAT family N-acetyltransferase [Azospirillum doebereinerae]